MAVELVPVELAHIDALVAGMRPGDAEDYGHATPVEALAASLDASVFYRTCLIDGEVAAIYGVYRSSALAGGTAWLLATELSYRKPKTFLRALKAELARLASQWPELDVYIATKHRMSIRLADRVGFGPIGLLTTPGRQPIFHAQLGR